MLLVGSEASAPTSAAKHSETGQRMSLNGQGFYHVTGNDQAGLWNELLMPMPMHAASFEQQHQQVLTVAKVQY